LLICYSRQGRSPRSLPFRPVVSPPPLPPRVPSAPFGTLLFFAPDVGFLFEPPHSTHFSELSNSVFPAFPSFAPPLFSSGGRSFFCRCRRDFFSPLPVQRACFALFCGFLPGLSLSGGVFFSLPLPLGEVLDLLLPLARISFSWLKACAFPLFFLFPGGNSSFFPFRFHPVDSPEVTYAVLSFPGHRDFFVLSLCLHCQNPPIPFPIYIWKGHFLSFCFLMRSGAGQTPPFFAVSKLKVCPLATS